MRSTQQPLRRVDTCPSCQTTYHCACLNELGGCSTLGCLRRGLRPPRADRKRVGPRPRSRRMERALRPQHALSLLERCTDGARPLMLGLVFLGCCAFVGMTGEYLMGGVIFLGYLPRIVFSD